MRSLTAPRRVVERGMKTVHVSIQILAYLHFPALTGMTHIGNISNFIQNDLLQNACARSELYLRFFLALCETTAATFPSAANSGILEAQRTDQSQGSKYFST